jgi:hypothetical protein
VLNGSVERQPILPHRLMKVKVLGAMQHVIQIGRAERGLDFVRQLPTVDGLEVTCKISQYIVAI